jgi:type VII secretion-associated protein (TIGR03931 family)
MQYFFRVNVRGKGYALYTCKRGSDSLQELPLDISSETSADFISAQNQVDKMLAHDPTRPYFWASSSNGTALVVYACHFPVVDEYGRQGIVLVQGFQAEPDQILDLVSCVIRLVSPAVMTEVCYLVSQIATGDAQPTDLVPIFDRALPEVSSPLYSAAPYTSPQTPLMGAVVHDCGGSALAWLGMTLAHHRMTGSWAVFDDLTSDGKIVTKSSEPIHRPHLLSNYIRQAAVAVDSALVTTAVLTSSYNDDTKPFSELIPTRKPHLPPNSQPTLPSRSQPQQPPIRKQPQQPSRKRPLWLRSRWRVAGIIVVAVIALMAIPVALRAGRSLGPTDRFIAQYNYHFDLPKPWSQTGSDTGLRRTEIKPIGEEKGFDSVLVEEQVLDFDSDTERSRAINHLSDDLAKRGPTPTPIDFVNFVGRDVVHYRQITENTETDWYVLFHRTFQVSVGCHSTAAGRERVQRACETVVSSMTFTD